MCVGGGGAQGGSPSASGLGCDKAGAAPSHNDSLPRGADSHATSRQQLSTCFPPDILQNCPGTSPRPATGELGTQPWKVPLDLRKAREQGTEQLLERDGVCRTGGLRSTHVCALLCLLRTQPAAPGPVLAEGRHVTHFPGGSTWLLLGPLCWTRPPLTSHSPQLPTPVRQALSWWHQRSAMQKPCSDMSLGLCHDLQSDRVWLSRSPSPRNPRLPSSSFKEGGGQQVYSSSPKRPWGAIRTSEPGDRSSLPASS